MKPFITEWKVFKGKAKVSQWRRVGCNIEIQEMYEFPDEPRKVTEFIDQTSKYKIVNVPGDIELNMQGLIAQTFNSKRHNYKGNHKYYVLVNTIMRVNAWDKNRTEHDDFIAPHILH